MSQSTVAILGVGPRGLSILERLLALYNHYPFSGDIDILLIDPNEMGVGTHSVHQSDHLLVNTVACQITLFGDDTVKYMGPVRRGPNFYQWAIQQGYRNIDGDFICTKHGGKEIEENDYLPRCLLGQYLSWAYREFLRDIPAGIRIHTIHERAVNIRHHQNGKKDIIMTDGSHHSADFIYITTGHSSNVPSLQDHVLQQFVVAGQAKNSHLRYYPAPYPTRQLDEIDPESRVLVQGIGLTAYDVLSQLTSGRGGTFAKQGGQLHYIPSGREPMIALFSRQALPFSSRGCNQKGSSGQYFPSFFTPDAIHHLRMQTSHITGSMQLDFETQLLPLLLKEMSYVYHSTLQGHWQEPDAYVMTTEDAQRIETLMFPHQDIIFTSLEDYTRYFVKYLEADLCAAAGGNINNPIKASTDVLRDVRDILREATDFGGLTGGSHKSFIENFNPNFNRISVGPPVQRNQELKALMAAGVVTLAGGPSPALVPNVNTGRFEVHSAFRGEKSLVDGDVLIKARIDGFSPLSDKSPLIRNLLEQGIFRPFINQGYHPGGIDIDRDQHPINRNGEAQTTLWALGNVVEGPNFYTYVLPRPEVNSRALQDSGRCVIDMYQQLQKHHSVSAISVGTND